MFWAAGLPTLLFAQLMKANGATALCAGSILQSSCPLHKAHGTQVLEPRAGPKVLSLLKPPALLFCGDLGRWISSWGQ